MDQPPSSIGLPSSSNSSSGSSDGEDTTTGSLIICRVYFREGVGGNQGVLLLLCNFTTAVVSTYIVHVLV